MTATTARLVAPGELAGQWEFRRRLVDWTAGRHGVAHGTSTVKAGDGSWHEAGELLWDGRLRPFTRTLGFTRIDEQWWVTFADGRLFHPWQPGVVVTHECRADTYRGLLVLDSLGDGFRIGWDVHGPGKRQRIVTRYRRTQLREPGPSEPGPTRPA